MKKADKNLLSGSTTLLVLSLLSAGDKYGYEMIAELEARSNHTFTLKEGTLYPILHTLEREGAVKSYEKEAPTGRTRKYYHVTKKGLRLLDDKKEEWVEFSKTVNAIRAGDDIKTIQGNLGHASAGFTLDRYGHFTERMKQDSAARMEGFIKAVFGS